MHAKRSSLGICIGASTIKVVALREEEAGPAVVGAHQASHECHTRETLLAVLREFDWPAYDYVCVTGRACNEAVNLPSITEPEASECALRLLLPDPGVRFNALVSLGSENFLLYRLDRDRSIVGVHTGNKCASGTGAFFLQQTARMALGPGEASRIARGVEPYAVAGRCSVFCKSDCTHALNKGIPKSQVCAGLGTMIADKVIDLFGAVPREDVLLVGGVTRNEYVMGRLAERIERPVVPPYADLFEALGAAAYALRERTAPPRRIEMLPSAATFASLRPLREAEHLVAFRQHRPGTARDGDETVLGLDVGSTTTKAVLVRLDDDQMLASVYLRTDGDPVRASRDCYRRIAESLGATRVRIVALGVTGSGRYIAGLHGQTRAVINEIIAHATAAAFFERDVDTILEIGGQDAKYTFLVNGVPCDYAMNEACSAGTGSFIEEAAKESLGIDVLDIQDVALAAESPANFNDQCAAFIGSDIKIAARELRREDIVAGIVYSVCMNYNTRVRGPRKIGKRIFMQGGVCYNRAVPLAMASILGQPIVVPPEPGLMGAFGVALETKQRLRMGLLEKSSFDLRELAEREVRYGRSFTCRGAREDCDRGCTINVIHVEGRKIPFGGVCNKYDNLAHRAAVDPRPFDFVAMRQKALFDAAPPPPHGPARTVGLVRSFLIHLLHPLYAGFFGELGFRVVLSDRVEPEGVQRKNSSFCFPAEIAHGMTMNLLGKQPDYVFLPLVLEMHVEGLDDRRPEHCSTCVMVRAESMFLRSAFPELDGRVLSPTFNFAAGWRRAEGAWVDLARSLGFSRSRASSAFHRAVDRLEQFLEQRRELGRRALAQVEADPERIGVVLFGRAYNAFAAEANKGIPAKFASRGVSIIPYDCLPFEAEESIENLNWASGHDIVRAARFVKRHPQLFGAFVTNFSCGPDSFVVGYFRDIMQTKPSLTLEIDDHTADAGVTTRVEAFLDIIRRYRMLGIADPAATPFRKARLLERHGEPVYLASDGTRCRLTDPRVKVVFPSMGRTVSELGAAVFRGSGIRAEAVPLPDERILRRGRGHTNCKECLPLILTVGSMLDYVERQRRDGERLLYFMPTTNGGCRFPQYGVFLNRLIEKRNIENLVTFTLSSENGYAGLGMARSLLLLKGAVVADTMDDVKNALTVLARDRGEALAVFDRRWREIVGCFETGGQGLEKVLDQTARALARVPLKQPFAGAKKVLLAGEIFVRRDEFSSRAVVDALAARGIVVERAPLFEWLKYIDYWVRHVERSRLSLRESLQMRVRMLLMDRFETSIKRRLARSGLCRPAPIDIRSVLRAGERLVPREFGGETILVVGRFFREILESFDGLISLGPFGCLPTRVIESILVPQTRGFGNGHVGALFPSDRLRHAPSLPFLSVESDGNPLPQIVLAQLEAFCLQVERVHASQEKSRRPSACLG